MQFRLRTLMMTLAAIGILIVSLQFAVRSARSALLGYDYSMQQVFEEIQIGETRQTLHGHFGDHWSIEPSFPRVIGYRESDFASTDLEKCVEYITWNNGINCYYCFGIDENAKVALKADGHP